MISVVDKREESGARILTLYSGKVLYKFIGDETIFIEFTDIAFWNKEYERIRRSWEETHILFNY